MIKQPLDLPVTAAKVISTTTNKKSSATSYNIRPGYFYLGTLGKGGLYWTNSTFTVKNFDNGTGILLIYLS